jgi:hypothetical protein
VFCRGFRQATRGPDTGAFHHPLFCRDKPDLLLGMVCQRSRDRKLEAGTLKVSHTARQNTENSSTPPITRCKEVVQSSAVATVCSVMGSAASVTDDSRSEDSYSEAYSTRNPRCTSGLNFITTDKIIIAMSLKKRDEMEHLRVAKAMLYESFMQAMNSGK